MGKFTRIIDVLYEKCGLQTNPKEIPVPVWRIPEKLGYTMYDFAVNEDNEHVSGAVLYDKKQILLNPKENARRRIFTLAHEIGHIVLEHRAGNDRMVDTRSDLVFPLKRTKEYEANEFAGELLMPEEEFRKEWNEKKGLSLTDRVGHMTKEFGVSFSAVTVRLEVLGLRHA
jgi:Zn-dependent peptidase ImmA (M78 family)